MRRIAVLLLTGAPALFGQAQPRFEVASLKPVAPMNPLSEQLVDRLTGEESRGRVPMAGQRVMIGRMSLTNLIALACRVERYQVAGPSWMLRERFEIEAEAPQGSQPGDFYGMLLSLLEDRFDLRWHRESKTGRGYELVVDKKGPRLTESQPAGGDAKTGSRPDLSRMPLFPGAMGHPHSSASGLCEWFADILHAPVTDRTGLTGYYDVTLAAPRDPMERESGTWLLTAVEDLGLRLRPVRVALEEIVVDSVEKTPKPN